MTIGALSAQTAEPQTEPQAVSIAFVETLEGIDALEADWLRLEAVCAAERPVFFQSFAWCRHIAKVRMQYAAGTYKPLVVVWRSGRDVIAILPLAVVASGRIRVAMSLDDPFGQLTCILACPTADVAPMLKQFLETLRKANNADILRLAKVLESSPLYPVVRPLATRETVEHGTVIIDIKAFSTPAEYRASLSKRTRRAQRNSSNRLMASGDMELIEAEDPETCAKIVDHTIIERMEWMELLGKTAPAFRDPAYIPMMKALAHNAPGLNLIAFRMQVGGTPIAQQWGFLHFGRYYAQVSSRSLAHDALGPGRLHLEAVAGHCIKRKIAVMELMSPASNYKLQLGGQVLPITDFELPLTRLGYLWLTVWAGKARPLIKAAYEATPMSFRRKINALAHKG